MYEAGLSISLYLVNSIAGSIYMQKFLRGKHEKKVVLFAWTSLYYMIQSLILDRIDRSYPLNDLVGVLGDTAFVLLLLMLLYNKDFLKQLFVAVSFVAGKEIIKYIIVVMNYGEYWAISKFSITLLKKITTMKEVEIWSYVFDITRGLVFILLYACFCCVYFFLKN